VSAAAARVLESRDGPVPTAAETAELARQQLSRLINAEVLAAAAREKGVSVAPGEVDARLGQLRGRFGGQRELEQQTARVGVGDGELREFVRGLVLADKLGETLLSAASVEQVRAAHILVRDKATADRLAAQVRQDPARFAALARQFSGDAGSKNSGGDLGYQTRGAFVPAFSDAMFGARRGEVVVVQTEFGWHAVRIVDRRTVRPGQLPAAEAARVFEQERDNRVAALLSATARRLGVTVNPRFGRWDARTVSVAAPGDELSVPDRRDDGALSAPVAR
jgi:parvulin-like peptidyl-prolyl isomerase